QFGAPGVINADDGAAAQVIAFIKTNFAPSAGGGRVFAITEVFQNYNRAENSEKYEQAGGWRRVKEAPRREEKARRSARNIPQHAAPDIPAGPDIQANGGLDGLQVLFQAGDLVGFHRVPSVF